MPPPSGDSTLSKMTREEVGNGRDYMLIDGEDNAVPDGFNADYLKAYYDGKHPGCDQSYSGRREFSFTLDNDIYLLFQSFNTASELENAIKEKCPFKIDIGRVYSVDPSKRHAYSQGGDNIFTPVERELVFDIKRHQFMFQLKLCRIHILLCGERRVLFDNKTKDPKKVADQLRNLLLHVNSVVEKNGGKPYTSDLFKDLKECSLDIYEGETAKQSAVLTYLTGSGRGRCRGGRPGGRTFGRGSNPDGRVKSNGFRGIW